MKATTYNLNMAAEQDEQISRTVNQERKRLLNFIRKRVPSDEEAEDIMQDVFYQLVSTYRMMKPVEQVTAWMFTVARNKITDFFRKKKTDRLEDMGFEDDDRERSYIEELLPSQEDGPDAVFVRNVIVQELDRALQELPQEQREVFVMYEYEGRSFKEISEITGVQVNTLISRKRYALLYLRERLNEIYEEFIHD